MNYPIHPNRFHPYERPTTFVVESPSISPVWGDFEDVPVSDLFGEPDEEPSITSEPSSQEEETGQRSALGIDLSFMGSDEVLEVAESSNEGEYEQISDGPLSPSSPLCLSNRV